MMVKLGLVFMIFENGESFEILCCGVQVIWFFAWNSAFSWSLIPAC